MDKNKLFKISKLVGIAAVTGLAVYSKLKKKVVQEEVIDITPEQEQLEEVQNG